MKKGLSRAPARGLLRAVGISDKDFDKPLIAIANSFNTIVPGHMHLNKLVDEVKKGIDDAGGVSYEFGVPGICDGIAMGQDGTPGQPTLPAYMVSNSDGAVVKAASGTAVTIDPSLLGILPAAVDGLDLVENADGEAAALGDPLLAQPPLHASAGM